MASILLPKIRTYDHTRSSVLILLLVPKSLLHGIPITATVQDLHHPQYLQTHKTPHRPNDSPSLPPKNSSILPHIAILVPHEKLVMKSYMHVWMVIVAKHYNLNANIENTDWWELKYERN